MISKSQKINGDNVKLIIVASMQKSGSSWFCNMLVDVLGVVEDENTRDLRKKYNLEKILASYYTPTLRSKLSNKLLDKLISIASQTSCLVFKTHRPPIQSINNLLDDKVVRIIYIYRDPRDIIVSALDHGAKERKAGKWPIRGFAKLTNFERALNWYLKKVIPTTKQWLNIKGVVLVRYEDLLNDTNQAMRSLLADIKVSIEDSKLDEIIQTYAVDNIGQEAIKDALHLNKAKIGRFKDRLSIEQQDAVSKGLGSLAETLFYKDM